MIYRWILSAGCVAMLVAMTASACRAEDEKPSLDRVDAIMATNDYQKAIRELESFLCERGELDADEQRRVLVQWARLCDFSDAHIENTNDNFYRLCLDDLATQLTRRLKRSSELRQAAGSIYQDLTIRRCEESLERYGDSWRRQPADFVGGGECLELEPEDGPRMLSRCLSRGQVDHLRTLLVGLLYANFGLQSSFVLITPEPGGVIAPASLTPERIEEWRRERRRVKMGQEHQARRDYEESLLGALERQLQDPAFRQAYSRHLSAAVRLHAAEEETELYLQIPERGRAHRWRELYRDLAEDDALDTAVLKPVARALERLDASAETYAGWLVDEALPKTEELFKAIEGEERRKYAQKKLRQLIQRNKEATAYQRLDAWVDFAVWSHDVLEVDIPLGALGML